MKNVARVSGNTDKRDGVQKATENFGQPDGTNSSRTQMRESEEEELSFYNDCNQRPGPIPFLTLFPPMLTTTG